MKNPFAATASALALLVASLVALGGVIETLTLAGLGLDPLGWRGAVTGFDLAVIAATELWPIALLALAFVSLTLVPRAQLFDVFEEVGRWLMGVYVAAVAGVAGLVMFTIGAIVVLAAGIDNPGVALGVCTALGSVGAAGVAVSERSPAQWVRGRGGWPHRSTSAAIVVSTAVVLVAMSASTGAGGAAFVLAPAAVGVALDRLVRPRWWSSKLSDVKPAVPVMTLQGPAVAASRDGSNLSKRVGAILAVVASTCVLPRSQALSLALIGLPMLWALSAAGDARLVRLRRTGSGKAGLAFGVAALLGAGAVVPSQLTPWHSIPAGTPEPGTPLAKRLGSRVGVISRGTNALMVVRCDAAGEHLLPGVDEILANERSQLQISGRMQVQRETEPTIFGTVIGSRAVTFPFAASLRATWAAIPHGPNARVDNRCG